MKRKDLDEAYDEFSGFAISSPVTKIRRLDAGVPPYMVNERSAVPLAIEEQLPSTSAVPEVELMMDDALPSLPSVDEKALVLYKPSDTPLTLNPGQSNVSLLVSPDLIESLKNRVFNHGINRSLELKSPVQSNSLAVVPWVPKPGATTNWHLAQPERQVVEETMEDEEERSASMEVEEAEAQANTAQSGGESFSRWQQQLQHCVVPELRPNPSTSIMWSW
ncbi:uncharacterized protein LOC109711207 isoform X1 [Ananas comosus]|uniref:Uncharacterized protein LOC109711207 isoform X1 n=2 Tax=Ananas comosus TaxID=4615 RepID=A0A199US63_ANACO|nr:uncharacterized protein LOC109711207 isoform X1 [Ananas comosus]OAY67594.1 hypothetical protein ACMD2_05201 [Ananas comosus]